MISVANSFSHFLFLYGFVKFSNISTNSIKFRMLLDGERGTVFALDHRIPNGVPIENYRYYVQLGREMLGLPSSAPSPFVRMAF